MFFVLDEQNKGTLHLRMSMTACVYIKRDFIVVVPSLITTATAYPWDA